MAVHDPITQWLKVKEAVHQIDSDGPDSSLTRTSHSFLVLARDQLWKDEGKDVQTGVDSFLKLSARVNLSITTNAECT